MVEVVLGPGAASKLSKGPLSAVESVICQVPQSNFEGKFNLRGNSPIRTISPLIFVVMLSLSPTSDTLMEI
jgi:hypothetical protein